jgi:Alginate lyase
MIYDLYTFIYCVQITPQKTSSKANTNMKPADIISMRNWYLTLPCGMAEEPDTVESAQLMSFSHPRHFKVYVHGEAKLSNKRSVTFGEDDCIEGRAISCLAHCGGYTTTGSNYPRTELRELNADGTHASWSPAKGEHVLHVRQSVIALPEKKPSVVVCQIHDDKDDVIEVRLTDRCLEVIHNAEHFGRLDDSYTLGKVYDLWLTVKDRQIVVKYKTNEFETIVKIPTAKDHFYFKVGCYTQSNVSKGDHEDSFAEVLLYKVAVSHRS